MKINWFTNLVMIIGFSFVLMKPIGAYYELITKAGGSSFYNIDPDHLLSGFIIGASFLSSLFASLQNNLKLFSFPLIILLINALFDVRYSLYFDLGATALGLIIGYFIRQSLALRTPKTKKA